MGGKITRPGEDTGLVRAKSITEALKTRSPILSLAAEPWPDFAAEGAGFSLNSPEAHQAFLEQLVECTPEAISILDPHQRVLRVNGEFTRMFGFDPEQTIGKSIDSIIVPSDRTSEIRKWSGLGKP
jgi:PAS domain-containing protein